MKTLIFKLTFSHDYYPLGVCNYLILQPDKNAQAFIGRYKLMIFQQQSQLMLHHFGPASGQVFLDALSGLLDQQPLVFNLTSNNPYFANISDVPLDWCGQMNFDSTQVTTVDDGSGQSVAQMQMQLVSGAPPGASQIGKVSIYPQGLTTTNHFAINIKGRKTHWHYYVFNRNNDRAEHRFKDSGNTWFHLADYTRCHLPQVDIVAVSGTFAYHCDDPVFCLKMIEKLYGCADRALIFNMLDQDFFDSGPLIVAHDKPNVVCHCKSLCGDVTVKTGYLDNDFTVMMQKLSMV